MRQFPAIHPQPCIAVARTHDYHLQASALGTGPLRAEVCTGRGYGEAVHEASEAIELHHTMQVLLVCHARTGWAVRATPL